MAEEVKKKTEEEKKAENPEKAEEGGEKKEAVKEEKPKESEGGKPEGEGEKKEEVKEEKVEEKEEKKEGEATKEEETKKPEGEGEKKEEVKNPEEGEDKKEEGGEKAEASGESEAKKDGEEKDKVSESEDKPKKKFGLSWFGGKKKKGEEEKDKEEKTDESVKSESMEAVEKAEAIMASKIQNEIMETSDMVVIKLSKSKMMLMLGILVMVMWAIPIGRGVQMAVAKMDISFKIQPNFKLPWQKSSSTDEGETVKVRIRDVAGVEGEADAVAAVLRDAGYEFVEIQKDTESEALGMQVITKQNDSSVKEGLEALLSQKYELSSPSAQLTDDSDFDAVVVLGVSGS